MVLKTRHSAGRPERAHEGSVCARPRNGTVHARHGRSSTETRTGHRESNRNEPCTFRESNNEEKDLELQCARPLQTGFSRIRRKMSKKCLGGHFWGSPTKCPKNVKKMSWGPAGVQLGFGKMSKKCQKNVPQTFF